MGFVSFAGLAEMIRENVHRVPGDVDLIVGIPRSGMIPAYMIGLYLNRVVVDLEGFLVDQPIGHGSTRPAVAVPPSPMQARSILLVDDSALMGGSIRSAVKRLRDAVYTGRITECAAIVVPEATDKVDLYFSIMPLPRLFEWNAFHHVLVEGACFDMDGILCADPTEEENDDGERYRAFLGCARPHVRPTRRIAHIVSARLERYRPETEAWLAANGIEYGTLHLVNLPTAEERRRQGAHVVHKARVYMETGAPLFYESEPEQARQIARLSHKPVLCTHDMTLHLPDRLDVVAMARTMRWHMKTPLSLMKKRVKRLLIGHPAR